MSEMNSTPSPGVWRRLTVRERGHFSNYPTLCPVVELRIKPTYMEIRRRWAKPARCSWNSVRVTIDKKEAHKSYGTYSSGKYLQRLCVIEADGKRYTFDVSEDFPDFANPEALLAEIGKYTEVIESPMLRKRWFDWWKFEQ